MPQPLGLVYANDWFVFPHTLPIGSVARVQGIALTNVFGRMVGNERQGWAILAVMGVLFLAGVSARTTS